MENNNGSGGTPPPAPDYRHVRRLVVVLILAVAAGLTVKQLMVPKSFGDVGHYRADALPMLANIYPPVHQGREACEECHPDVLEGYRKDVHRTVQCENCHGPADRHIAFMNGDLEGVDGPEIAVPKSKELCLGCHRRLAARPATFPQIDPAEHYKVREVNDENTPCFSCHSPHTPLFLETPLDEARKHPIIYQCGNCHREAVDAAAPRPKQHPDVFDCGYCHNEIARDFETRAHAPLGCGTCHQFYVESETAGRIVKHSDPRFCLLCHEDRSFVTADNKPVILWPDHRDDVSEGPQDAAKVCADCHRDAFHLAFNRSGATTTEVTP